MKNKNIKEFKTIDEAMSFLGCSGILERFTRRELASLGKCIYLNDDNEQAIVKIVK